MPDSLETLSLVSEVAVAIAGFSGIVVALGRRAAGQWTPAEQINLQNVLIFSLSALFLSLAAIGLLHSGVSPEGAWRVGSALWFSEAVCLLIYRGWTRAKISASDPYRSSNRAAVVLYGGSVVFILLSLSNVVVQGAFWPFQVALTWSLFISCDAFVRLVMTQSRHKEQAA